MNFNKAQSYLKKAQNVKLGQIMPIEVQDVIQANCFASQIPFKNVLPHLITATAHLLKDATIKTGPWDYGMSEYTILCGNSGVGKASSSEFIFKYLRGLDQYEQIDSTIGPNFNRSVNYLVDFLRNNRCAVAFFGYDQQAFEIQDDYYRCILKKLYDAPDEIFIDQKERFQIKNPRFSFSVNSHPLSICQALETERLAHTNPLSIPSVGVLGILSRILILVAAPERYSNTYQLKNKENIKLYPIFMLIKIIHKTKREYKLTETANSLFENLFDKYGKSARTLNFIDDYLASISANTIRQICRIATIIKAISLAVTKLKGSAAAAFESFNSELESICFLINEHLTEEDFLIDIEIFKQAVNLVEYFNLQKLILSGYSINADETFDTFLEKVITNKISVEFASRKKQRRSAKRLQSKNIN